MNELEYYEKVYSGYIDLMTKAIDQGDRPATIAMCRRCLDNLKILIAREIGL